MKSKLLTLGQISLTYSDMFGNQNTGTKGLMSYEIKMSLKFKLHLLAKALEPHFQFVQKENEKLLQSYGGQVNKESLQFQEYLDKLNEIMKIEHEIEIPELYIDEFEDLKTTEYPANLFNLIS